jgi:hypothetical protein
MKKQSPALPVILYAITVLLFSACFDPLGPKPEQGGAGANTGRVLISIIDMEESPAEPAESRQARTLLPEFSGLSYTVTIINSASVEVFNRTITELSISTELEAGSYIISILGKKADSTQVCSGIGSVVINAGVESPVTIRMASLISGTGSLNYTVAVPSTPPLSSGVIEFISLSGGTNPPILDLSAGLAGTVSTGTLNLPAGYYRAVLRVEARGKKVAKTLILHIAPDSLTSAEFNLVLDDFLPSPPAGGSVVYITSQAELAAIRDHIGSAAMNYGKNAYVLFNDVALSGTWTPIGDGTSPFQGYFFGENHRITGLTLQNGTSQYTGLFGMVYKALIQDLTVETAAAEISLEQNTLYIGLVAGGVSDSELLNITLRPANLTVKKQSASQTGSFGGTAGIVSASRLREITVTGIPGSSLSFLTDPANTSAWTPCIGGIAGTVDGDSEILESAVSLNINLSQTANSVQSMLGGIAGSNRGTIRRSSYTGTLNLSYTGTAPYGGTGGIAGTNRNTGTIEECYASPRITTSTNTTGGVYRLYTGGLAGENTGTLRNSYAVCEIEINATSSSYASNIYSGGTAGGRGLTETAGGLIEKCYAAGSLQIAMNRYNTIYTGGISGGAEGGDSYGTVSSSAALIRTITSPRPASRILGAGTGTLDNNIAFNNIYVNGLTLPDAVTNPEDDADGLGKTAAQLESQSSYSGLGWDFTGVWEMGSGAYPYPVLKWQNGAAPALPPGFELLRDEDFETGIQAGIEAEINLNATATVIYKTGSPNSLTLTVPAGYDGYRWLVDGRDAGTSRSLSMYAANYTAGSHHVTAIVYRGTVPYSKNMVIQVVAEIFTDTGNLGAYLAALSQNSAQTPYPVKLDLDIGDFAAANGDPLGALFAALGGRYVILDLSACGGTAIADDETYGHARVNTDRLVGILLPDSLTAIGSAAFAACNSLVSIDLPAGLTSIGYEAFLGCSFLASIELPAGLTSIGDEAFQECSSLASIELPAGLTSIGDGAFYRCSSLASIELPAGLTSIGVEVFTGCMSLTSVDLPAGLARIGDRAFWDCTSLASVELPAGLTSIGQDAFANCPSLASVELPAGLTSIGFNAFSNCTSFTSLICRSPSPPSLDSSFLWGNPLGIPENLLIHVPAASVEAYKTAPGWSDYADRISAIP